ncbi:uncharacterized protein PV07_00763 [Cladophialophora immunda]|uniref:Uncharacterized protein n=1 Tax=Cladophialophora immunda TaxID=569365 RepID=A0A0D2B8I2_9EURO|nr:uncharacterized protein PV07_00763 [Cladophialophora immunda]KIW33952.1 hypothetical protein PV07_00763 [Cladophialophora immunda]OQU94522.1 hypothetical protein CLAIMM_00871 [Cladophialophora immunda]
MRGALISWLRSHGVNYGEANNPLALEHASVWMQRPIRGKLRDGPNGRWKRAMVEKLSRSSAVDSSRSPAQRSQIGWGHASTVLGKLASRCGGDGESRRYEKRKEPKWMGRRNEVLTEKGDSEE